MVIRRATPSDIDRILYILQQVLEVHAKIRPDIFVPGTTKYSRQELTDMVLDDNNPIFVADDEGEVLGYVFCQIKEPAFASTMVKRRTIFIDDFCVDEKARGKHVGESLFEFVKEEARRLGCYDVTLNVWTGNDGAEKFYEKMGMKTRERQMEFIL